MVSGRDCCSLMAVIHFQTLKSGPFIFEFLCLNSVSSSVIIFNFRCIRVPVCRRPRCRPATPRTTTRAVGCVVNEYMVSATPRQSQEMGHWLCPDSGELSSLLGCEAKTLGKGVITMANVVDGTYYHPSPPLDRRSYAQALRSKPWSCTAILGRGSVVQDETSHIRFPNRN